MAGFVRQCVELFLQFIAFADHAVPSVFLPVREHANLQSIGTDTTAGVEHTGAHEDAGHCIVVGGRDGIKFVVVAARAGNRQPEKLPSDHVDLVIGHLAVQSVLVGLLVIVISHAEKTSGNQTITVYVFTVWIGKQITGELVNDEIVVRHVVI